MPFSSEETDATKGQDSSSCSYCFLLFYIIVCVLLSLGHLGLLLWQQTLVLEELDYVGGSGTAYVHAIPTWLPLAVCGLTFLLCQPCLWCGWCCETTEDRRQQSCTIMLFNCRINIFVTLVLGVLFYTIQVIVYLWVDIAAYLDHQTLIGSCFCFPVTSDVCPDLQQCECDIPFAEYPQTVVTNDTASLGQAQSSLSYKGQVKVIYGNDASEAPKPNNFHSTERMVLFLQLCLVVITLRFPVWIIMSHYDLLREKLKLLKNISKNYRSSRKATDGSVKYGGSEGGNWKDVVCASLARDRVSRRVKTEHFFYTWFVLEICFYCYVEGADVFTLVEEIMDRHDYFASNRALTTALLFFISLTLIIISLTSLLQLLPRLSHWITSLTRLAVVIASNLPLFILRIYMFVVVEHITGADVVFVLFTIKEVMLLVLASAQAGMEFVNAKMRDEHDDTRGLPKACCKTTGISMTRESLTEIVD